MIVSTDEGNNPSNEWDVAETSNGNLITVMRTQVAGGPQTQAVLRKNAGNT